MAFFAAIHPGLADPGDALDTGGGGIDRRLVYHADEDMAHGRVTAAIDYLNQAITHHPAYMRARFERGRAYLSASRFDAAIDDFTAVIAAHPEYPLVYMYRGLVYLHERKPEQAIAEINLAMRAPVGITSYLAAQGFLFRSLAFQMLNQPGAAIEDFHDALRAVNGDFHEWLVLDATCLEGAAVGLVQNALLACDQSIHWHDRNPQAYAGRGLANLKAAKYSQSVADYTQALFYQPDNSFALYGRGLAKRAQGDGAGAAADMQHATAEEPHIAEFMTRLGVS